MISQALLNLPARLRARGVTVVEMPGWKTRDRTDGAFAPIGILDHHDGMGIDGDNVPRNMIRDGQNGAQIWIKRNGSVYMLAAGRMWHAGEHPAWGDIPTNSGNRTLVGIETDYAGTGPWPGPLLASWRIVRHELAKELGITADLVARRVAAHKEIAPGRKPDPANFDPSKARGDLVADLSTPAVPAPAPLPTPSPAPLAQKDWFDMATKEELRAVVKEEIAAAQIPKNAADAVWGASPVASTAMQYLRDMRAEIAGLVKKFGTAAAPDRNQKK